MSGMRDIGAFRSAWRADRCGVGRGHMAATWRGARCLRLRNTSHPSYKGEEDNHETFHSGRRCVAGPIRGSRYRNGPDHHRAGDRQHRRHPARGHRRGGEPGAHRGQPHRLLGRGRTLHPDRPAAGGVHADVQPAGVLDGRGRGAGPAGRLHGHRQRRAVGGRPRGDGHRLRAGAAGRRPDDGAVRGARPRDPRRHPDRQHAAVDGAAHHRHQDEPPGGGADHRRAADLHVGARDEPVAGDHPGRRPEHEQHRRRRRRPELPQPPGQPGDGVRDQRDERRDLGRRGAHQHGPARGRQPAERPALVRRQPRQPAARRSRQPLAGGAEPRRHVHRGHRDDVRHEPGARRPDRPRPVLVLRQRPELPDRQEGDEQLLALRPERVGSEQLVLRRPALVRSPTRRSWTGRTAPSASRASTRTRSRAACCG